MITIGESYKVEADNHQYILHTRTVGKDKDGKPKESWGKTYHVNIKQVMKCVADNELRASVRSDTVELFEEAIDKLCAAVEAVK